MSMFLLSLCSAVSRWLTASTEPTRSSGTTRLLSVAVALAAPFWLAAHAAGQQAPARPASPGNTLPRTADGKPNLQGIWQVRNRASYDLQDHAARYGMPAGHGV